MRRLFWGLYLLLAVSFAAYVWLIDKAVDSYFQPALEHYSREAVRGQMAVLVDALRPLPQAERVHELERLKSGYGLGLAIVEVAEVAPTAQEHAELTADRFIMRKEFTRFIAPLDFPVSDSFLQVDMPPEPPEITPATVLVYGLLAVVAAGVLILWVRPHWRDLETLRATANRLGAGELSARAAVPPRSGIRGLADHFNQMAERTERLVASQRELVNAVSHELRTPIARLSFELDLIENAAGEADRRRLLAGMRADLHELETLVAELLNQARLDNQPQRTPTPVVARAWLDEAVAAQALTAAARGVECVAVGPCPETVPIEPVAMTRALGNLLGNAVRHARGRVEVRLEADSDHYRLLVDDDGPGIPAAERERVFEPFVRLDQSRDRATGGVGLGLAIVQRVVLWHHGAVEVLDSPLGGCRFAVRWPVNGG